MSVRHHDAESGLLHPDSTAREAATLMRDNDCGSLPVVANREANRLVGTVTDRDLAIRGIAAGHFRARETTSIPGSARRINHFHTSIVRIAASLYRSPAATPLGATSSICSRSEGSSCTAKARTFSSR